MIDHIGFAVSNMDRSKPFYVAALKPLGIAVVMEVTAEQTGGDAHAGFGKDDKAFFWIGGNKLSQGDSVLDRRVRALPVMGQHGVRGVADQHDAAPPPST